MAGRNESTGQCLVEAMNVADVRRLARALGIPVVELLNASISLSENIFNGDTERVSEFSQLGHPDVSIAF